MIIATCSKCNSDDLTLPNRYRTKWKCRACGARFARPKMVREPVSDEDMRERQAEVVRQELYLKGLEYLRTGKMS
jgi:ribosomal protein L37AE/L43A